VANNHAADQFLVVANGPLSGVSVPVVGRTTPASGLAFGPVITIASDGFAPDVGGDPFPTAPSHYGVVFERAVEGLGQLVFFQLVRTDGTLGSSTNLDLGLPSTARPAISSSNSGVHWNLLWRDLPTATNGNVLGAQVRWDGVVITPPFTVDASASHDLNAQPSAPMEDADRWVVAFDRTGGGGNRNVVCKLLEGTTVLDTIDVSAAENAPAIGDQFEPAIDTDGQCVAVAYTQFVSFPSADEGVRVATLAPVGNQLLLSEGQIALGSSATVDENRARIVSTAGSGDAVGRFMAVFEVETGGTAFGDIGGGLYASDDFTSFCSPGADGVIACPCANPGGAGRGCANSSNANGGQLTAAGSTVPDSVVLTASGVTPTGTCVFTQGTTVLATAVAFGDGVRCAGGTLKRLYVKSATGGVAAAPSGADPTITARSAALGDPIAAGTTRAYYVFYRDPAVFACSSTFNSTNAILVQW
jgi:hypothetical protein